MYLVVGDHKTRSLMTVLWSWTTGKKGYRNMKAHLIATFGPGVFLYKENEEVRRALLVLQSKYNVEKDNARLRVFRIDEIYVPNLAEDTPKSRPG